jgi:TRAP-type uncharacterized transport system fused permease subunit
MQYPTSNHGIEKNALVGALKNFFKVWSLIRQSTDNQNIQGTQKTKLPKNQRTNNEMGN